jgi:ABC-type branched-subunit amino acid transport system substrate-binding protein
MTASRFLLALLMVMIAVVAYYAGSGAFRTQFGELFDFLSQRTALAPATLPQKEALVTPMANSDHDQVAARSDVGPAQRPVVETQTQVPVAAAKSIAAAPPASGASTPARSSDPAAVTALAVPETPTPGIGDSPRQSAAAEPVIHGVSDKEIRFGMASPFVGANREAGRQLKLGVETAFAEANTAGGIAGRQLKLVTADDGYEPSRTLGVVQNLYDKEDVFGFIGNFGSATAAISVPFALEHRALFLGALSGANLLRRDPPDRYVFNYRPSYSEETGAAVRYLVRVRRIQPKEIAVFAQDDAFGDAGFDGVAKAMRTLPNTPDYVTRMNYKRNTIDVQDAVAQLQAAHGNIKAIVMVATYRAAAKFIEKTRELYPQMIYTNVSAVGATSLADELMLLGPRYAQGVIVTQDTPAVDSSATVVLNYKADLSKYFPGEAPDYTSFESYIDAKILIKALKRAGRQVDPDKLVDTLESMHDLDLGLGTVLHFNANEHQGSHKVWGTALDDKGYFQPIDLE